MKNLINNFLLNCYNNGDMNLRDIQFSKLFEDINDVDSYVVVLFASLISLSNRLGHVCLPISKILNKNLFTVHIFNFLNFFLDIILV